MNKLLFGMAMTVVATAGIAQGKLTGFEWTKVGDGLTVKVLGESLEQPKIVRAFGNKSYILEFKGNLIGKPQYEKINFGGVEFAQSTWFTARPPRVRLHLRLDPEAKLELKEVDGAWTVSVNVDGTLAKAPKAENPLVKIVNDPMSSVVPSPTAKFEPKKAEPRKLDPNQGEGEIKLSLDPIPAVKPVKRPERIQAPVKTEVVKLPVVNSVANPGQRTIDLEFVNTDLVQVLRALAMEGNVNIVTAPDVKGTISVSLNRVSVTDALNLVTSLSGLYYTRMGNTYVVAADPARLRAISQSESASDTRVVPIYSGQAAQVRAAVQRSMPTDGRGGSYDIVLPSEGGDTSKASVALPTNDEKDAPKAPAAAPTGAGPKEKDMYVVLVGPSNRLDELERAVRRVDTQICDAIGITVPSTSGVVREVYYVKSNRASFLLASLSGGSQANPTYAKMGGVELFATPLTSIGDQAITLMGRENEVQALIKSLEALDQVSGGSNGEFAIVEVKYLDPRSVKQDLEAQFPGLTVALTAVNAGTPGLFKEVSTQQSASGSSQSSQTSQQSSAGSGQVKGEDGTLEGITMPFANLEQQAFSLKIRLRGPRQVVEQAQAYLAQIDIEPKQIALELRVMDLSKEDALRVGIDWGAIAASATGNVNLFRLNQGLGDAQGSGGTVSTNSPIGDKGRSASVTATLDQIANDRNLIARPNLFAYDGRQSELFVGDVIRYVESIQSTQNGITITSKELPVGVRVAVLPRIGGDGRITLDLRPVVSTLNGFTPVPGGGQLPQTSLRIAQNTITVNDGETIAIGGLIQESDIKRSSGIPILKDLPILGKLLFSRTDNSKRRTEMVFFVTAKVLSQDGDRKNLANPARHRGNIHGDN